MSLNRVSDPHTLTAILVYDTYIYRERERERAGDIDTYMCIHIHIHTRGMWPNLQGSFVSEK